MLTSCPHAAKWNARSPRIWLVAEWSGGKYRFRKMMRIIARGLAADYAERATETRASSCNTALGVAAKRDDAPFGAPGFCSPDAPSRAVAGWAAMRSARRSPRNRLKIVRAAMRRSNHGEALRTYSSS